MKAFKLSIALFVFALTTTAQAERWIVENAKHSPASTTAGRIVSTFSIGEKEFTVMETERQVFGTAVSTAAKLQTAFGAEAAYQDLEIGLVDGVETAYFTAADQRQPWHVIKMNYNQIHKVATGRGVIVAVLDTGVDYRHSALKENMWVNKREIADNGIDDDKNGFIDDVHGFNFDTKTGNPMDTSGHGTHCAGVIAADIDQRSGAMGVAPEASIMAIKVIGRDGANFLSNAAMAIKYATDNGAKIISNSWRVYKNWSQYNPTDKNIAMLKAAIEYAQSRGVIFVVATGNEAVDIVRSMNTNPLYPVGFTGLPLLVGVGSSDVSDSMSSFSNYGRPYTSVLAPGSDIYSTYPNNSWTSMSGTSMATPLVSGALALALQNGLTPQQAVRNLVSTATRDTNLKDKTESEGIINLINYIR